MAIVNITINGQKIEAQGGQTVLEAAQASGVDIPTLCHHPALAPQGSCRMCLVEIERQRSLQPSCTFPVSEGMVVHTESPKVQSARRFVLELLFSERIHYCMYCQMSGSEDTTECELQRLAYRYGLDHWEFAPNTAKRWPVDASRTHFIMDHSRCILCRRCVRACDEIAGNHTLGVRERGARTMIIADADVPFGDSSCVSCGTCLQVCPTGALMDRRSAYMGHPADAERTATTCMACPVGCGIQAVTRSNQLLRVESDWEAANGGLLCVDGRFAVVDPQPARVTTPLVRKNGVLQAASWDEALDAIAAGFAAAGSAAGLATPRATNEALGAFTRFMSRLGSDQVGLLYGELPPTDLGPRATLGELSNADCVVVVGGKPLDEQKVAGYIARRATDRGATMIVVNDTPTELDGYARQRITTEHVAELPGLIAGAARPVVLYAAGLAPEVYQALQGLAAKFLPLYRGTNAAGAAQLGLGAKTVQGQALFVLAEDDLPGEQALPAAAFTVVQSAYRTAWADAADVVLPGHVWSEQEGHIVNIEGRELPVVPFLKAPASVEVDRNALVTLSERMAN